MHNIQREYRSNIDKFSQNIIISQIELLLNYCECFYQCSHQILERLEKILDDCFNNGDLLDKGLPTAQHIAGILNVSPNYLGSLLKATTGQTTQHHSQ